MEQAMIFKAFDGTQFDTAAEYLEYERNNLPQCDGMKDLLLFDKDANLIPFQPGITYSYLYDNMQFFVVLNKTEESLACLHNILYQGCYDYPDQIEEGHIYSWSSRDGWYDYSEKFCQMKETVDIIISTIEFNKDLRKRIEQAEEST